MQFVLVHGTFTSNRTWEVFESELNSRDPSLTISYWPWSGANAQGGRMESAKKLALYLNQRKLAAPKEPLILVGHSHGGNICRAAASYAVQGAVQGIIYIATPHLVFSKKRGRGTVCFLYAMFAYIIGAIVANKRQLGPFGCGRTLQGPFVSNDSPWPQRLLLTLAIISNEALGDIPKCLSSGLSYRWYPDSISLAWIPSSLDFNQNIERLLSGF